MFFRNLWRNPRLVRFFVYINAPLIDHFTCTLACIAMKSRYQTSYRCHFTITWISLLFFPVIYKTNMKFIPSIVTHQKNNDGNIPSPNGHHCMIDVQVGCTVLPSWHCPGQRCPSFAYLKSIRKKTWGRCWRTIIGLNPSFVTGSVVAVWTVLQKKKNIWQRSAFQVTGKELGALNSYF